MKNIKTIIFIVVIFFISRYIINNLETLKSLFEIKSYLLLFNSFFIIITTFFVQVSVYKEIFGLNNVSLKFFQALRIYSTAVMTAYIPGKLPGVYLTAKYAKNFNKKEKNSFISIVIYQLLSLVSCAFVGSLFVIFLLKLNSIFLKLFLSFFIIFATILLVNPRNYTFIKTSLKKIFGKEIKYKIKGTYLDNIKILCKLSLSWIFITFSISLLNSSITGYWIFGEYLAFTAVFLFSQILGSIVFILPSGLGVFESAMYYGVQTFISIDDAIRLSAISRIFMLIPAFLVFFIDFLLITFLKKNSQNNINI